MSEDLEYYSEPMGIIPPDLYQDYKSYEMYALLERRCRGGDEEACSIYRELCGCKE